MKEWIIFTNRTTGEEYAAITSEGATVEEVKETRKLLAAQHEVELDEVTYAFADR